MVQVAAAGSTETALANSLKKKAKLGFAMIEQNLGIKGQHTSVSLRRKLCQHSLKVLLGDEIDFFVKKIGSIWLKSRVNIYLLGLNIQSSNNIELGHDLIFAVEDMSMNIKVLHANKRPHVQPPPLLQAIMLCCLSFIFSVHAEMLLLGHDCNMPHGYCKHKSPSNLSQMQFPKIRIQPGT